MAVIALNFRFINKISILLLEVKVLMIFMAVMSDGIEVKVDSPTEDAEKILVLARLKMPKRLFYL